VHSQLLKCSEIVQTELDAFQIMKKKDLEALLLKNGIIAHAYKEWVQKNAELWNNVLRKLE
jgi:hypothetical protein